MSRVDRPELKCDRCGTTTLDTAVMGKFERLAHPHMSGENIWDLCPTCWSQFIAFQSGKAIPACGISGTEDAKT